MEVLASGAASITLFYNWVSYVIVGGYCFGGCITTPLPPPRSVYWSILDSGFPVGLFSNGHAYADKGRNIIHLYVRILHTLFQHPDKELRSEQLKYRPFWCSPIKHGEFYISLLAKQGKFYQRGKAWENWPVPVIMIMQHMKHRGYTVCANYMVI